MNPLKFMPAAIIALTLCACGKDDIPNAKSESDVTNADQAYAIKVQESNAAITEEGLAEHIKILASDGYEGRAPTTEGGRKTREYIAAEFERLGIAPLQKSYFLPTPLLESTLDTTQSFLRVNGDELSYAEETVFWTKQAKNEIAFEGSDIVFVGYGIVAPEFGWNDYEDIDVRGKTVLILVNDPGYATQNPEIFGGNAMTYYGRWTYKFEEAARQGAAAALVIHDTAPAAYGWDVVAGSWTGAQIDLDRPSGGAERAMLEGWITKEAASEMASLAGFELSALYESALSDDFSATPFDGLAASASIVQSIKRSEDANVVGVLRGSEAPDEYVLYMGHWDHLGVNPSVEGEDKIFNGAVDNATGISAILEIAEKFASLDVAPRRSIIFAAVTAEESGLLGSAYFAEAPPVPLSDIVGGINIDAILPLPPTNDMIVVGYGASELEEVLADAAAKFSRTLRPDPEPEKGYFYRSDHISLAKKGVPMLYADAGVDVRGEDGGIEVGKAFGADYGANRYHKPSDEYDASWRLDGINETAEILFEVGDILARSDEWPNWYEGNEFRALRDDMRAE